MNNFKFTSSTSLNPEYIFKAVLDWGGGMYIITNETLNQGWMVTMSKDEVELNLKEGNYKYVH